MAVNWIGLIGKNTLMIPRDEITTHSLTHNTTDGYIFSKPLPKEKYFEKWQSIFFQGGELQEHWKAAEIRNNQSYVFMPFCGDYIFIYLEKKQSGNRIATILNSKICQSGDYLAEQSIKTMEGMKPPSPQGIGISINDGHITIPSSQNSGIGLSSWLFLNKKIKPSIGVSSGVPVDLLNIISPEVSSWLIEDESQTIEEGKIKQDSHLLQLIRNCPEPKSALNDFLMLEEISSGFEIDSELLIQIFLKDEGVRKQINAGVEIELRIILGDRNGALDLLINENKLLNKWMNQPIMKYNEVPFPFTITELSKITNKIGDNTYPLLKSCFNLMVDYSTESKIQMAQILTRYGSQEDLEQIWKSIDSSHQDLINGNLEELFVWRENPNINNFWKIIELIEGSKINIENDSKRLLLEKIISHSVTSSDLIGVMHYVPDMLGDKNQYESDWNIMIEIESDFHKILLKINEIYPSAPSIQKRILLYIDRKLEGKNTWRIQDILPSPARNLVLDKNWMRPILEKLEEKHKIYSIEMPSDAYDWISSLSPSQYLEALNDPILKIYLLEEKTMMNVSLLEWPNPKAIGNDLSSDEPTWVKRREWANLCVAPSIFQRIKFHQDKTQYALSYTLFAIVLFSLINIMIFINENELVKVYYYPLPFSIFGIAIIIQDLFRGMSSNKNKHDEIGSLFKIIFQIIFLIFFILFSIIVLIEIQLNDGTLWTNFELVEINFNGYSIPLLNNPLLLGFIVVIFWRLHCYFFESAREKRNDKSDYINNLKK